MSAHRLTDRPLDIVLVLDHAFVSGGQAKVALDSAFGLKDRGHNPIVFAAVGPVDPALKEAGIEVVCLGQNDLLGQSRLAAAWQGIWNAAAARALADRSRRTSGESAPSFMSTVGRKPCRLRSPGRSVRAGCRPSIRCMNIFCSARTAASTTIAPMKSAGASRCRQPVFRPIATRDIMRTSSGVPPGRWSPGTSRICPISSAISSRSAPWRVRWSPPSSAPASACTMSPIPSMRSIRDARRNRHRER